MLSRGFIRNNINLIAISLYVIFFGLIYLDLLFTLNLTFYIIKTVV